MPLLPVKGAAMPPTSTPEIIRIIATKPELVDQGFTPFTPEVYILHFAFLVAIALFVIPLLIWFWRGNEVNKNPDTIDNSGNMPEGNGYG